MLANLRIIGFIKIPRIKFLTLNWIIHSSIRINTVVSNIYALLWALYVQEPLGMHKYTEIIIPEGRFFPLLIIPEGVILPDIINSLLAAPMDIINSLVEPLWTSLVQS